MTVTIDSLTDASFETEVLEATQPVLVDFWAPWCGPCKMLAPLLEKLATEYAGRIRIVQINTDQNKETVAKFSIRSLPTLIMFKDGQAIATCRGMVPKSELQAFIDSNI